LIPPLVAIGTGAMSSLWLLPLSLVFLHLQAGESLGGTTSTDDNELHFARRSHGLDLFDNWPDSSIGLGSDPFVGSSLDSDWLTTSGFGHQPSCNIDGTPMLGAIDINGNPHGVTTPACNIDGTPMVGWVDIHGHPYGVTDSHAWDIGGSSGSSDIWHHSDAVSSCGMNDSWSSCGTSDSWSSCATSDTWSGGGSCGSMWD